MQRRKALVVPVLLAVILMVACGPLENTARDVIAGAKGFIEKAQENHSVECKANPAKPFPCQMINQAVGAQNLAVDALATYCGWSKSTPPNTTCHADKTQAVTLKAALENLNQIIAHFKQASGGQP